MIRFFLYKQLKVFLTGLVLLTGFVRASAQTNTYVSMTGTVLDSANKSLMADASVAVINLKDSLLIKQVATNSEGVFYVKGLPSGNYNLIVSFQGYQQFKKTLAVSGKVLSINVGLISMSPKIINLGEVVVEALPIKVTKDTTEFRASAFKTGLNATAEDLLKKLPGINVAKNGTVKAQGEDVSKVYVDGKEFFSNDPKIATRNITADMIEAVQVYNDMSEQAKFTGIDDGSRSKTINIKLKKNRQKGSFGKATGGYGTDSRFQGGLTYNNFKGRQRVSVITGANNLNDQDLGSDDKGGIGNGVAGMNKNNQYGINYINKFGTKLNITGNYNHLENQNTSERTGILQSFVSSDSLTIKNDQSESFNKNRADRFNLRLEYAIDSNNSILYTPSVTVQNMTGNSRDTSLTNGVKAGSNILANTGIINNLMESKGINTTHNILYRKRFNKPGRTLTIGDNLGINTNDGTSTNLSFFSFYSQENSIGRNQNLNIRTYQTNETNNNTFNATYTEPLGKKTLLELNYSYLNNKASSGRKAFNYDSLSNSYNKINSQQTNYFENLFHGNRYGANFKLNGSKDILQVGVAIQTGRVENTNTRANYNAEGKDSTIVLRQNYKDFFPVLTYSYNFNQSKNLRINYNGRTRQPSAVQLQPVPDVSNPLHVRIGNPFLNQEFTNNLNIGFNSFNNSNYNYFSININASKTSNKIVNSIDTLSPGILNSIRDKSVELIKPINVTGAYNTSSDITLGIPLRTLKGSSINFTNSLFYNRDLTEIYKFKNVSNQLSISQSASANLLFNDKMNVSLKADISYNKTTYSIQKNFNTQYFSQQYLLDLNISLFKNLVVYSTYFYRKDGGITRDENLASSCWNAAIADNFLRRKNATLKLSVNDILRQNKNLIRIVSENYINTVKTRTLNRYFLLTFTYNFNGAAKSNGQQR